MHVQQRVARVHLRQLRLVTWASLSSGRQHLSYGGCLGILSELFRAVLCTTNVDNGMHKNMSSS